MVTVVDYYVSYERTLEQFTVGIQIQNCSVNTLYIISIQMVWYSDNHLNTILLLTWTILNGDKNYVYI